MSQGRGKGVPTPVKMNIYTNAVFVFFTATLTWFALLVVVNDAWRVVATVVFILTLWAICGYVIWTSRETRRPIAGTVRARVEDGLRRSRDRK